MKCSKSKTALDGEWFHQLLREAQGVTNTPSETYSELHLLAHRAAMILAARLNEQAKIEQGSTHDDKSNTAK